jgi:hypothetical protein
MSDWPFSDPPSAAAITMSKVVTGQEPILHVAHDEDDGSWQFLPGGAVDVADAMMVSLESITKMDPSVLELADLPLGWTATRTSRAEPWQRECRTSGGSSDSDE